MLYQLMLWVKYGLGLDLCEEQGQGLVEYALIILLVAIVVIAALLLLGPAIGNIFNNISNALRTYG
jgi:pilus assembly protein Flp/PilA